MSKLSEKTTIYLNPYVKKFLQHKAINEGRSISEVINDNLAEMLEDLEDGFMVAERKADGNFKPWVEVKRQLKDDGKL